MTKERIRTKPNLTLTSPVHLEALKTGDDHFRSWQRNVVDRFKGLPEEEIKKQLQGTAFPYAVCFENWINDFNISSGFRNANAFNAREVFYIGDKKIDRRGMCGVHNYMDIWFLPTLDNFIELSKKYKIVGVDNFPRAIPLDEYEWAPETLVVFGSEAVGLTPAIQALCDDFVCIPQYGSIRSLNCATASGIIMNDIVTKYRKHGFHLLDR